MMMRPPTSRAIILETPTQQRLIGLQTQQKQTILQKQKPKVLLHFTFLVKSPVKSL